MKNRKSLSPQVRASYYKGWLKALSNQEVIEIEKIKQLLSSTADQLIEGQKTNYTPILAFRLPE